MKWIFSDRRGRCIPADEYWAEKAAEPKRSSLGAPHVVSDHMPAVQSMVDGKMYDSKSRLRAGYRAAGVVEVGNDSSVKNPQPKEYRPEGVRQDIISAWQAHS